MHSPYLSKRKEMSESVMWIITGYGGMLIILLTGMIFKGRKTKYKFRIAGYVYMICLESTLALFAESLGYSVYHVALVLFWIWLTYKDIKSSRWFELEFARLDRLREESDARIAQLFYDRRN